MTFVYYTSKVLTKTVKTMSIVTCFSRPVVLGMRGKWGQESSEAVVGKFSGFLFNAMYAFTNFNVNVVKLYIYIYII